eukprot:65163_1
MDDADRPEKIVKKGRGLMKRQAAAGKSKKPAALSGVPKTAHGVAKGTQRLAETRISRSKPAQKETTTDFRGPRSFKDIMHEKKAEAIRQKLLASKRKREDEAAKSGIESPVIPGSPTRTGSVQSRESSKEPTSTGVVGSKQSAGVMRSKQSTGVTRSKQSTGSTSRTKRSLSRERKSPPKRKRSNSLTTSTRPPKHRIKPVSAKPAASPPTQYQMPSRSTNSAQLFGVSPTPQAMQRLAAFPIKPVIQSQNVMVRPPAVPFRNQGQALFTTPVVGHDSSPPFMQAGVVHPMSPQRLPVHPVSQPRTQPQLFQTRNQPQMSQPRSQPQLFQNRNQPQMSQPRTQPQLFQNRNQPQMSQTRNQSQMSQPRTQPQLFQTRNQPQMSHPHNQSQASQSRNQSQELVSRPRKQSQVSQSPNKSQLSRPRNQSQVSHSRNQSPVSRPRKQQQSGVPAGLFTSSQQMDSSSDIISLTNKLASPNKPASVVSKSTGVVSKPTGVVSKPVGASQPAGIASSWPVSSKASNTAKRPAVLMSDSGQKYTKSKASKTLEATQSSKSASQKPPMMKRRRLQPISEAQQTTPAYEKTSGVILRANVSPPVDKDRVVGQPSETSHTKPVMTPSHSTRDDPEWASSPREPSGVSSKPSDIGSKPAKPADSGSKPAKQADSGLKPGIAIESASQPKIDNPKSIPSSKQISVPQISPTSDKHQLNRSTETSSNASSDSDDLAKPTPFSAQTIAPKITTSQSKPIKSKRDDISPPKNPKQSPDMSRRRVSTNSPSKHHDILRHIMQSSANPSVNNRSTSVKQPKGRKSLPSGPTKPISPSERRTISPKVPSPVSDSLSAGKNMPVVSDTQSGSNVFHPEPASPIRGPRNTIRPASKPFLTESPESKVLYVLSDSDASSQVAESPGKNQFFARKIPFTKPRAISRNIVSELVSEVVSHSNSSGISRNILSSIVSSVASEKFSETATVETQISKPRVPTQSQSFQLPELVHEPRTKVACEPVQQQNVILSEPVAELLSTEIHTTHSLSELSPVATSELNFPEPTNVLLPTENSRNNQQTFFSHELFPANPQETSASQVSTTAKVHQTAPHAPATAPHVPATVPQFSASAPQFSASAPQVSVAAPQQSTTKPAVMPGVSQTKVSQQSRPSQTVNCERSRPTSTKTQLEANKDLIQFLRDQQLFKQYIDTLAANRKSFLNKLRSRPDYNEIEAKVRATPRAQRAEQTARFVRAQLIRRHESTDELSEMLRRGLPREQRELIVSSGNMSATEVNALASQVPEFMKRILGRIDRGK